MSKSNLRQLAYQHIHNRIADGTLGMGTVVSELSLAEEIGISRTPIREAIRQLQVEGLVEQIPRFGTVVRRPRRQEVVESYQLREALEPYAVGLTTECINASDLAMLKKLCERLQAVADDLKATGKPTLDTEMMKRFLAADMAFHVVLIRGAGNSRIMKIINEMHVLKRVFGVERQTHSLEIVEEAYKAHEQILDFIERGMADSARQAMARHIRISMKQTLDDFDKKLAESESRSEITLSLPQDVLNELEEIESELATKD